MMRFLAFLVTLFIAHSAFADGIWRKSDEQDDAASRSKECGTELVQNARCYHTYRDTADTDSVAIVVKGFATLCFVPDIAAPGAATATIGLWRATGNTKVTSDNEWMLVLNSTLTGDWTTTPQLACIWDIPPGTYYIESVVAPGATEEVVVSLQGW